MNPEYTNTVHISKTFTEWTRVDLQDFLGVEEVDTLPCLTDWFQLAKQQEIKESEFVFLDQLRKKAYDLIDYWNETELREKLIVKLTDLVNFNDQKRGFADFAERYIVAEINHPPIYTKLYGYVDWLVATGYQKPKSPFFFIHEYKPVEGKSTDGKGQLLAALLVAQKQHETPPIPNLFNPKPIHFYKNMPLYGVYVKGQQWTFIALKDRSYAFSKAYICTIAEDLHQIVHLLKAQKQIIHHLVNGS